MESEPATAWIYHIPYTTRNVMRKPGMTMTMNTDGKSELHTAVIRYRGKNVLLIAHTTMTVRTTRMITGMKTFRQEEAIPRTIQARITMTTMKR